MTKLRNRDDHAGHAGAIGAWSTSSHTGMHAAPKDTLSHPHLNVPDLEA